MRENNGEELLPCPFCGTIEDTHLDTCYFTMAILPLLNGHQIEFSEEALTTAWTTRHPDPVKAELAEALRGLYSHTKNNHVICGLNSAAEAALKKSGVQNL